MGMGREAIQNLLSLHCILMALEGTHSPSEGAEPVR